MGFHDEVKLRRRRERAQNHRLGGRWLDAG